MSDAHGQAVEALAVVLSKHNERSLYNGDRDIWHQEAEMLLASDWLAAHDAEVRAAERERIGQAIEAHRDKQTCLGCRYSQTLTNAAARIARQEPDV